MTAGAALFDLEIPEIKPGAEANIALVDLEAEWEAGAEGWESRSQNSCFAGRKLHLAPGADDRRRPRRLPPARLPPRSRRMSTPKLDPDRAALVVVDVQEGFRKAIPGFEEIAAATATLVQGADALDVPIVVTEQYPKGLGETVAEVAEHLPEGDRATAEDRLQRRPRRGLRPRRPRAGDRLRDRGARLRQPDRARPARRGRRGPRRRRRGRLAQRREREGGRGGGKELGLAKAERAGAWRTSVETALFELLGEAGGANFKTVQRLVLDYAP